MSTREDLIAVFEDSAEMSGNRFAFMQALCRHEDALRAELLATDQREMLDSADRLLLRIADEHVQRLLVFVAALPASSEKRRAVGALHNILGAVYGLRDTVRAIKGKS